MERHRIDKAALRETITALEGLTNEQKAELLQLLSEQKRYGLVWEDHAEDVEEQLRTQLPVLCEDSSKRILSADEKAPNHILIEGDNLHALTALTYTHEGRVDVIYIDPPYNTGNKDFVYNDSFVDSEDGYRHSKWLSFMHKRLKIAKRLLSDRGVIFISIDDNEQANLKLLCDEVFGENNAIGPIIQNKLNAKNDTLNIQKNHEYILVYRKTAQKEDNGTKIKPNILVRKRVEKPVFKDNEEFYFLNDAITTRGEGGVLNARQNLGYTFYYNPKTNDLKPIVDYNVELAKTSNNVKEIYNDRRDLLDLGYVAIRPPKVRGMLGCWTWEYSKAKQDIHHLVAVETKNRYNIVKRTFVSVDDVIDKGGKFTYMKIALSNSRSILDYSTNDGTASLTSILGNNVDFNNPKNLDMIKYFLEVSSREDSLILDFFAGSGTTLHATMQLNAEDGGHRQCILVTNNENGICENVTYKRNQRVIQGYPTPKGVEVPGLSGNNLRYYRTDFVERETTRTAKRQLMMASTELLCIKHDVYDEQPTFGSITLRPAIARYFTGRDTLTHEPQQMLIIYRTEAIESLVTEIAKMPESTNILVYVFSTNNYAMDADFEEVSDKVTLCALPTAIYNAYLRVLPKRRMPKDENEYENENLGGTEA